MRAPAPKPNPANSSSPSYPQFVFYVIFPCARDRAAVEVLHRRPQREASQPCAAMPPLAAEKGAAEEPGDHVITFNDVPDALHGAIFDLLPLSTLCMAACVNKHLNSLAKVRFAV